LLKDPYADKAAARRRVIFWLVVVLVAAWLITARVMHWWPFQDK
jgi:hypothetical protein